ncbi:MAG: GNAT family N-acetyltransferase [Candidatus Bathyarchaeia archaeon]
MLIRVVTRRFEEEFFKAYEGVYASRAEVKAFYGGFLDNGWVSGAWKDGKLIGVLAWFPRESVKNGLAEILELWVASGERRKGVGEKLVDHAVGQMKRYYRRFGAELRKVMLFTGSTEEFSAARALYEKKGFRKVATVPKDVLDNPYGDEYLYVLQMNA